jgi:GNAT superfamily N-acetyltransferase
LPWDGDRPRLEAIVAGTWQGTRDCPRIEGIRAPGDVVEGYLAIGRHRAELFALARMDGQDGGCLLLADHPLEDHVEIIYMGLLPDFRERRLGGALVAHAQQTTRTLGRSRLIVSVDAANEPAVRTYHSAGLRAWNQQQVWFRDLRSDTGSTAVSPE